ncbi:MAG: glycosyltransferase family 4 protein, partial [Chloroflexi bacterium]|nr:glycosyltransferase family 4 protein [Chloroflexota bacterium]
PETREPGLVLFCGAMDRDENADAVLWFYRGSWPRVRATVPAARLVIAGNAPLPRVAALAADPSVIVTGYVPDWGTVYARADVCIAPSLVGGGVITKVIDGMAAGRPVVTTSIGNEGVDAPPGAVCVADQPDAFADAVVRLLRDPAEWSRVAGAGRAFAQRTYRWADNVDRLEDLYCDLAGSANRRPGSPPPASGRQRAWRRR